MAEEAREVIRSPVGSSDIHENGTAGKALKFRRRDDHHSTIRVWQAVQVRRGEVLIPKAETRERARGAKHSTSLRKRCRAAAFRAAQRPGSQDERAALSTTFTGRRPPSVVRDG